MRKFSKGLAISTSLAAATMAVAQDTNNDLIGSLLGGGVVGILVLALIGFFLFRFFFSGGD